MTLWKCKDCGHLSVNNETTPVDGYCFGRSTSVGNHSFTRANALRELANRSNWREGDNGLWHWKGSIPPYTVANNALKQIGEQR